MSDMEESLVTRRSRRSTAGNRMQAALAEMASEDLTIEAEDDVDFANIVDEEDIFESDFESTDEEVAQEDEDKTAREEETQERKAARAKAARATALAHERNKVTFNPQTQSQPRAVSGNQPEASSSGMVSKYKRRVSLGLVVNAETGEVIEGGKSKRQSQRKHTVMNTSETANRMKKSEEKRAAAVPKKMKGETRMLTQDELISRALDNEEGNIVEHRDYLRLEEEKRKRARVVRATIDGPMLRWTSKQEEIKVFVDPPTLPRPSYPYYYGTHSVAGNNAPTLYPLVANPSYPLPSTSQSSSTVPPKPPLPTAPQPPPSASYQFTPMQLFAPPRLERTEKVTKNYVTHELGQFETTSKPTWKDTMEAMFGDHVKWEDLRVFVGKARPLARPKSICPITGLPAVYLDPRTGVPFANVHAYETITRILAHEYVWSDTLGCYLSHQAGEKAIDVNPNDPKPD